MVYDGKLPESLKVWGDRKIADGLIENLGKRVRSCTVANTMTSVRPGISDAATRP